MTSRRYLITIEITESPMGLDGSLIEDPGHAGLGVPIADLARKLTPLYGTGRVDMVSLTDDGDDHDRLNLTWMWEIMPRWT